MLVLLQDQHAGSLGARDSAAKKKRRRWLPLSTDELVNNVPVNFDCTMTGREPDPAQSVKLQAIESHMFR